MISAKKPREADKLIGMRLRSLRLERNMSQTALGLELGVTFQQIQKYENGINRITGTRMQRAAEVLGVPLSHFYGNQSADDSTRLMALFEAITDLRKRKAILTLVESMAT